MNPDDETGKGLSSGERIAAANATLDSSLIADLRAGQKKTVSELWSAFTAWLSKSSPEQYKLLNPPATNADFERFREVMQYDLPENIKQLYRINNGGVDSGTDFNLILGWVFLPIEQMIDKNWQSLDQSIDPDLDRYSSENTIKRVRENPKWIPLASDGGGNYMSVDLDPDEKGVVGQVIICGRDDYMRGVKAKSIEDYLADLLLKFADGRVAIDADENYSWFIKAAEVEILGFFYFDKYENGQVSQSLSVKVERRGNEITVQTGDLELGKSITELTGHIDPNVPADEYNAQLLTGIPEEINGLRLRK